MTVIHLPDLLATSRPPRRQNERFAHVKRQSRRAPEVFFGSIPALDYLSKPLEFRPESRGASRSVGTVRSSRHGRVRNALYDKGYYQIGRKIGSLLQPRREEALVHQPDLVLDLVLLPARSRRAGDRLDELVQAHLEEAAIVLAVLADEDRVHCPSVAVVWLSPFTISRPMI